MDVESTAYGILTEPHEQAAEQKTPPVLGELPEPEPRRERRSCREESDEHKDTT